MKLPHDLLDLSRIQLNKKRLRSAILERRRAIRSHRDQKLDDRCWLDDFTVWAMLEDSPPEPKKLPDFQYTMLKCKEFYLLRREDEIDPTPLGTISDSDLWDEDLKSVNARELMVKLYLIQEAIRIHRDTTERSRMVEDDRKLYQVLPEKIPADFRLPPEKDFLGEAKAPDAGCPSFWKSHSECTKSCNLHKWGGCL